MKAVVAYRGGDDTPEALELGATLRRTTGAELVVAAVLPAGSEPGTERVDLEYRQWLDSVAEQARRVAVDALSQGDPDALEFRRIASSSVADGLVRVASEPDVDLLVLGSARAATEGSLLVGSVSSRLLHSSPVPILLAPQGYGGDPLATFGSLTCAYAGTDQSREALAAACALVKRYAGHLRVATFVPRADTMYPPEGGLDAEDLVAAQWAEQAVELHEDAVEFCRNHGVTDVETAVARGRGWAGALTAIPWTPDDLLVLGSSRLGPLARVFLGSTATKILRHTPVPTLVVPSGSYTWPD
ncbi:universal stress protein [Kribbella sp. CA-293567]|uniref:universal stress protein n=1 Tax=Kribbella sp. CA-293567 TaxID=3002436 RepID=UPI0022DD731D|nr:universal stress protein [Kribbella sp. CA-293567]WBQ04779.1 universal stress protein [Kribbella sp. CA-293567]